MRAFLYTAQTLKNYIRAFELDIYGSVPVRIPRPELYVVYTGEKADVPDELTLSDAVFGGVASGIDTRVTVIKDVGPTVAGQYIDFAKTIDAYRISLGPNEDAVRTAIRDCVERGVLVEYLKDHEKEVVSIMMTLYDEQEVMHNYLASARRAAEAEGMAKGRAEGEAAGIVAMCKEFGVSVSETAAKLSERLGMTAIDAEVLVEALW